MQSLKMPYVVNYEDSERKATTLLVLEERRIEIREAVVFDTPSLKSSNRWPGLPQGPFLLLARQEQEKN